VATAWARRRSRSIPDRRPAGPRLQHRV